MYLKMVYDVFMNLMSVVNEDTFHYIGRVIDPKEWYMNAALRQVSEEEIAEFNRLYAEYEKLQTLLKTIHEREEFEYPHEYALNEDPYADHEYCPVCRECVTCNLRPCRDGGEHPKGEMK